MRSRSIARALRHGKLSEHKATPEQFVRFMTRTVVLDIIVGDCVKAQQASKV